MAEEDSTALKCPHIEKGTDRMSRALSFVSWSLILCESCESQLKGSLQSEIIRNLTESGIHIPNIKLK